MSTPAPAEDSLSRQDDLAYVMGALSEGENCSLTGMSNIGKSFLLRNLRRPEVQRRWGAPGSGSMILVYVDFNLMWEMTDQGFYEVILRGIMSEIDQVASNPQVIDRVRQAYQNLINPTSSFLVPVSFGDGLMALNPGWERRLVLLLDEFDEPWANIDRRAFLNLRALRDRYLGSLCFVTATLHPLACTRPDREIGEFCELFAHRARSLAPLKAAEALELVRQLAAQDSSDLSESDAEFLVYHADGHPGLLQASYNLVARAKPLAMGAIGREAPNYERVRSLLDSDETVRTECAKLWNDLTEPEQKAMMATVSGAESPARRELEALRQRHYLAQRDGGLVPFCRLFEGFVRRQVLARSPQRPGVRVDVEAGDVYVDGKLVPALTDLEYRMLLLLYGNLGKICDKYTIVEVVWGDSYIDQVDDARIEKLVSRLRQKLGEDPANPQYLVTVRGRGYRLSNP